MNARTIGYWATTGLTAFPIGVGGFLDAMRPPQVIEGFSHLGYPVYFAAILGVWKVLGAITIVAPRFPRLKEWAYAGIAFDLSGAALSSAAVGDGAGNVIAPLVLLAIVVASWALRPESRVLPRQKTAAAPDGTAVHGRSASFA